MFVQPLQATYGARSARDGTMADASVSPMTELYHVHECLRVEITRLAEDISNIAAGNNSSHEWTRLRDELAHRFRVLGEVYESHSKAEDDIIIPALRVRNAMPEHTDREMEDQHNRQALLFAAMQKIFDAPALLDSPRALNTSGLVDLADSLRASIVLHLKCEEEELLPVLWERFSANEISNLVGRVMGERGAELMANLLEMAQRDLAQKDVEDFCVELQSGAGASREHFDKWLSGLMMMRGGGGSSNSAFAGLGGREPKTPPTQVLGRATDIRPELHNNALGCRHSQRNLRMITTSCCSTVNNVHTCAQCHDEARDHVCVSREAQWWCASCHAVQTNPGKSCASCGTSFAAYSCTECLIFESNPQVQIWHCPYCNVCRRSTRPGVTLGRGVFHCMRCGTCVDESLRAHKCVERTMAGTCPVCVEDLFTSRTPLQYVPCGHLMHRACFQAYVKSDYRCTTCRKSLVSMAPIWKKLDALLAQQQSAPNAAAAASTMRTCRCFDCGATTTSAGRVGGPKALMAAGLVTLQVGEKCTGCSSYNTADMGPC